MAVLGAGGNIGHTHAHSFRLKLMRQIYDGCWPQQIKLTVMYGGERVSHCTNGPHTYTHMRTHPSGGPLHPVLLVKHPCQAAHPHSQAYLHNEIPLTDVLFSSLLLVPFIHLLSSTPDSSCSQQTGPEGQLHIWWLQVSVCVCVLDGACFLYCSYNWNKCRGIILV